MRTPARLLLVGVLAAALVAGCSSASPRPDFAAGYTAAAHDYRTQFASLQSQAPSVLGQGLNTQLALFSKMQNATTVTLTKLRSLKPPARVQQSFRRLLGSLQTQQGALKQIQSTARANDQAGLNDALRGYALALQDGISLLGQVDQTLGSSKSASTVPSPSRSS